MNRRMQALWDELELTGDCPELDVKRVTRQVNAKLNADPSERKLYMKQKIRFAAVLTAAVVALCGTALAVVQNIDVLTEFFEGDTSAAEELVDREVRSDSDEAYTLTVDGSMSDGDQVYFLARVEAKTPEAAEFLMSDEFGGHMSPFQIDSIEPPETEKTPAAGGGISIGGDISIGGGMVISTSTQHEVQEARTETSRTWAITSSLSADATGVSVRLWATEDDFGTKDCPTVEVPLTPAETVDLAPRAEGQGYETYDNPAGGPVMLERVHITPFSIRFTTFFTGEGTSPYPAPLLRMADGSLCTPHMLGKMASFGGALPVEGGHSGNWNFQFRSVMDLDQISAVVVFGMEYPVDGGAPKAVEVDPHLLPFSLRALCDGLGASCVWDNEAKSATITYRDTVVVLTLDSETALVNGVPTPLSCAPINVDGKLAFTADSALLKVLGVGMEAAFSDGTHTERSNWLVTP